MAVLSQVRHEKVYQAIQIVRQENYFSVSLLCQIAGIPRSCYYKWLKRAISLREQKNKEIIEKMILLYEKVDGIYGYRQLTINLNRLTGMPINHKRVYRLMKLAGIQSVICKKKKSTLSRLHNKLQTIF